MGFPLLSSNTGFPNLWAQYQAMAYSWPGHVSGPHMWALWGLAAPFLTGTHGLTHVSIAGAQGLTCTSVTGTWTQALSAGAHTCMHLPLPQNHILFPHSTPQLWPTNPERLGNAVLDLPSSLTFHLQLPTAYPFLRGGFILSKHWVFRDSLSDDSEEGWHFPFNTGSF